MYKEKSSSEAGQLVRPQRHSDSFQGKKNSTAQTQSRTEKRKVLKAGAVSVGGKQLMDGPLRDEKRNR